MTRLLQIKLNPYFYPLQTNLMKRSVLSVSLFALGIASCTEKGIVIDRGSGVASVDTTYLAATESPQQRHVLVEEFTGVSCPPCPQGHEALKFLQQKYPERVVVIGYHIFAFPQANPVTGASRQDFRTQDATDIGSYFGGVGSMPVASIDRVPANATEFLVSRPSWNARVDERIVVPSDVNLSLTSNYTEASRTCSLKVSLAYTKAISRPHNLVVAVIENDIIDAQKKALEIDTFYTHQEVLRDIVTPVSGVVVLDSIASKQPGRVFVKTFPVTLTETWNDRNCRVVAFVYYTDGTERTVLQAAEVRVR